MSFIGPRPLSLQEISARDRSDWRRFDIRPGFICLWWIRKRANIAYVCESVMDAEYVETHSFRGDLGIAFRAIPAFAAGHGVLHAPKRINLLGIAIDNLTMKEAADTIGSQASGQQARQICFVNADCVNIAHGNTEYRAVVRRASLVLADGIGIRIAGACLNQHIRQNVNGTDLLPFLCERLERDNLGVYLLGGRPGVAKATAARLRQQHARLKICGHHHGYFTEVEESLIIEDIRNSGARVLLVAMGAPRQELWIGRHLDRLGVSVALGVGGLFDFYSGRIPRAPLWMRELSLEWLYRFVKEPGRMWKRYLLGNPLFLFRMACSRLLRDGDSWEVIE